MIKAGLHSHRFNETRNWIDRLGRFPRQDDELARFRAILDQAEAAWNALPDEKALRWRLHHSLPRYRLLLGQPRPAVPVVVGRDRVGDLLDFSVHTRGVDQDVAVFYGGVGDARHFLGQLAMLDTAERLAATAARKAANNNTGNNKNGLVREVGALRPKRRYHFTMCDDQARVFARDLVLFSLLDELATARWDTPVHLRMELYTVVYFVYLGVVMPRFAHERLMQAIEAVIEWLDQDSEKQVLPWLRLSDDSRAEILRVLRSWQSLAESSSTANVLDEAATQLADELDTGLSPPRGCEREYNTFFFKVPFLQPPPALLERYEPQLLQLLDSDAPSEALRTYLDQHWLVNVTLLDINPREQPQDLGFNPFDFAQAVRGILSGQEKGGPPKTTLYDHVLEFFQMVAVALRKLRERLTVEIMIDDPAAAIDAISISEDREFPATFDLVHLTDSFGGALATIVQGRKILKPTDSARLTATSPSTSGLLHDSSLGKDHLDKLTQMQPLDRELPTPFQMMPGGATPPPRRGYMGWRRTHRGPFNYESLLPLTHLTRVLVTHFFHMALPPTQASEFAKLNLTSFFRLLLHLHEIGYPPHWLAEILHKILHDQHQSAPFVAEMTTLTVLFAKLLPFCPAVMPPALHLLLPAPQDIYSYTLHLPCPSCSANSVTLTLIFFCQRLFQDLDLHRAGQIPALLSAQGDDNNNDKAKFFREGGCIVVTALEWCDDDNLSPHHQVSLRFWMRRDIMHNITSPDGDEWACALWRMEDWSIASSPVSMSGLSVRIGESWVAAAMNGHDEMMIDD